MTTESLNASPFYVYIVNAALNWQMRGGEPSKKPPLSANMHHSVGSPPHLFTYSKNDLGDQAAKRLNDNEPTSSFRGKMFFTYLPDLGTGDRPRLWPLPSLPQRDPISGHTSVYVSFSSGEFRRLIDLTDSLSEARRHHIYTAFVIEKADDDRRQCHFPDYPVVLISKDRIRISPAFSSGNHTHVFPAHDGHLHIGSDSGNLYFRDLESGFSTWDFTLGGPGSSALADAASQVSVFKNKFGDVWELV
ncbi:hypothetical protein PCH_Pc12g05630 [Penicillium rubens Wisconsin 54-1255]|uniref:Uncharacterized protein n=1 Tax=Penicillium rubens (strain ATCC 28089 / DSM 1075 / NRRL 1951 / Wisconsin 54-1255) TaxID=500485 RepID=B6GZG2_PENRW|nr:hypothetical protein PCH_Pc12g05630 [Penicillium rubens Wisconsin 54-1255]